MHYICISWILCRPAPTSVSVWSSKTTRPWNKIFKRGGCRCRWRTDWQTGYVCVFLISQMSRLQRNKWAHQNKVFALCLLHVDRSGVAQETYHRQRTECYTRQRRYVCFIFCLFRSCIEKKSNIHWPPPDIWHFWLRYFNIIRFDSVDENDTDARVKYWADANCTDSCNIFITFSWVIWSKDRSRYYPHILFVICVDVRILAYRRQGHTSADLDRHGISILARK